MWFRNNYHRPFEPPHIPTLAHDHTDYTEAAFVMENEDEGYRIHQEVKKYWDDPAYHYSGYRVTNNVIGYYFFKE